MWVENRGWVKVINRGPTKIIEGMEWVVEKYLHLMRGFYKNKIDGAMGCP